MVEKVVKRVFILVHSLLLIFIFWLVHHKPHAEFHEKEGVKNN